MTLRVSLVPDCRPRFTVENVKQLDEELFGLGIVPTERITDILSLPCPTWITRMRYLDHSQIDTARYR